MTLLKSICLIAVLLALVSCSAGAPRAPLGFHKAPANAHAGTGAIPKSSES